MKCVRQTLRIYLSAGLLGVTGHLLEDLDGHGVFGIRHSALSDFAKAAAIPEAPKLVISDPAGQLVPGLEI